MTFRDWVEETRTAVADEGWAGARDQAYQFYVGAWRNVGKRLNYGECVYDHEWDLLVVLDACRADLMAEVAGDYDFVDDTAAYSVGSSSPEWLSKTFGEREATRETAYVTANPYSEQLLDPNRFAALEEVWRTAWDEEVGTIPARAVTDRAIAVGRQERPERLAVHYMQPHYPFVPDPLDRGMSRASFGDDPWDNVWQKLRKGALSWDEVWEGYRANLRYVLDDVALLLENVDAERVLVTADHGNLLGEFALYGHPNYVPIPALKRVPWCETSATDDHTREPTLDETSSDVDVETQLEHLGYRQ